jgi:ribosomal protein S18 acetylase RimI-like enzyme
MHYLTLIYPYIPLYTLIYPYILCICSLKFVIRRAQRNDTYALTEIYQAALQTLSDRHKSVAKYVKFSVKGLKQMESTYAVESGGALFVAEEEAEIEQGSVADVSSSSSSGGGGGGGGDSSFKEGRGKTLLGCLGVKVRSAGTSGSSAGAGAGTGSGGGVEHIAELSHFCVSEETQGRGVGRSLLLQALQHAESLAATTSITIHLSVMKELECAIHLYISVGFRLMRVEKLDQGCDLCHMYKPVK